jgi:hypothetical protein
MGGTGNVKPEVPVTQVESRPVARPQGVVGKKPAVAPVAVPTGITSIDGPANVSASSQAVPLGILPLSDEQAKQVMQQLSPQLQAKGQAIAKGIAAGETSSDLQSRWAEYIGQVNTGEGGLDVNALIQWVLRESYLQNTEDLNFYAQKVKYYNDVKKAIRDEIKRAQTMQTAVIDLQLPNDASAIPNPPGPFTGPVDFENMPEFDANGKPVVSTRPHAAIVTKGDLDGYIKGLEETLSSVGDDAQLANVDLQDKLQKQQATLQMMSNISKMLQDTAMAIIRKIGS